MTKYSKLEQNYANLPLLSAAICILVWRCGSANVIEVQKKDRIAPLIQFFKVKHGDKMDKRFSFAFFYVQ